MSLREIRLQKLVEMRKQGIQVYPERFVRSHSCTQAHNLPVGTSDVSVAGRVMLSRSFGGLLFLTVQDQSGRVQVACMKKQIGEEAFSFLEKMVDLWDFLGFSGEMIVTKHGEPTLQAHSFTFLWKALRPLPEKFHGVSDQETIVRQRYLETITDQAAMDRFVIRSQVIRSIREFFWKESFHEVETPTLQHSATGAAAKPYFTHNNALDQDLVLRISHELPLKTMIVGGFEKIFEIGKAFRNEGVDPSHLPEHTHLEYYVAYANYQDTMDLTERLIRSIFENTGISPVCEVKDKNGVAATVDFSKPFGKKDYVALILEMTGIDITRITTRDALQTAILDKGLSLEGIAEMTYPTMVDYLYKKYVRPSLIQPVFLYNYPKSLQPLARVNDADPNMVDQYQLLINGWEMLKGYSELVDPIDQAERFAEQLAALEIGDEEAMQGDDEYIVAMEYGMPPISGCGIGIDRLVTLLCQQENLRDMVYFPLIRRK